MALADGQIQLRDLIMGQGTAYEMLGFNAWSRSARATSTGERAWNHGSWSGAEWQDEATLPLNILVHGTDAATWLAAHQQLAAAFAPIGDVVDDLQLRFALGGREYTMFGRPRMVEPDAKQLGTGQVWTKAAFTGLDPVIYAVGAPVSTGLPTFTGGLTVPFTVPFAITATLASGFLDLVNEGTKDSERLPIRIDGPAPSPSVSLAYPDGTVSTLRLPDVPVDEWLDIDPFNRTVLANGVVSRLGATSGEWPVLQPGTTRLRWSAARYDAAAKVTVTPYSAWW